MATSTMKRARRFAVVAVFAIVAVAAFGFAAANTVPDSNAGDGDSTVSGYAITNVAYTLNGTNPANLTQVAFTIAPATGTVKATVDGGTSWISCTNTAGSVVCPTTASVSSVTSLRVVAAQ